MRQPEPGQQEARAKEQGRAATAQTHPGDPIDFCGEPEECDFCGRPLHDETFFADALLPGQNRTWGFLCHVCTQSHQVRAGWGQAQFYARREENTGTGSTGSKFRWVCVAGGPPANTRG